MDKQHQQPNSKPVSDSTLATEKLEIAQKSLESGSSAGPSIRAEIIAIGDELSSGVRLDTNSQWISQQLDLLGIETAFHSTVGDDLEDMLAALATAAGRVDLILTTGGLGPTADDLTRNIIAQLGEVELELNEDVLQHIKSMYQVRGREMPPNNEVQAWFPKGSIIIDNPEGTAPGIEFAGVRAIVGDQVIAGDPVTAGDQAIAGVRAIAGRSNQYHMFSFPGVPAELKQMWHATVRQRLAELYSIETTIFHHTIHCFGSGESAIEMELPDLIQRGRDPLVGITASAATISLRIATRGASQQDCLAKMQPTIEIIRDRLGDLVFGENGEQLEQAVVKKLATQQQSIAVFDWGLGGDVARRLLAAEAGGECLRASRAYSPRSADDEVVVADRLQQIWQGESWHENADVVLVIGAIDRDEATVSNGKSYYDVGLAWKDQGAWQSECQQFRYSGHSAWREVRAVKDVLNLVRLKSL